MTMRRHEARSGSAIARAAIGAAAAAAAAALLLALTPPLLAQSGHAAASWASHAILSPACHQDPERSFSWGGIPMGVCARCTGIVAGFLIAALAAWFAPRRPAPLRATPLAAAALPMAIQWTLSCLPWPGSLVDGNLIRALTGIAPGAVLALFVLPALVALCEEPWNARRRPRHEETVNVQSA